MSHTALPLHGLNLDALFAEGLREATMHAPVPWEPPPVEELTGVLPRLEVLRLIGRGGMGAVYEARQAGLERRVAVKVLPPELGANEAFAERFRREARALGRLKHPHILEVFEFGESAAGHLYFSMEYVEGGDLGSHLKSGTMEPVEVLRMVKEICAALEAAHAHGIIHRDIKPSNILLTDDGTVKVADFGLAVLQDQPAERLTRSGLAMGTFEYAAPEQAAGVSVDSRSDLYSVGVLCYELLTGRLPKGVFDPPSQVNAAVGPGLDAVVLTAMQNDPARRYQSAADFRTALELTKGGWKGGKPRSMPVITAAALLVAGVAIYFWWAHVPAQPAGKGNPGAGAATLQPSLPLLAEEAEVEKLFAVLASPAGNTKDARRWARASETAGLALTRQRNQDDALIHYSKWIARLEQERATAPADPRWMVALAATLNCRGNILQGADPTLAVKTFEVALALYRGVLKAAPDDAEARRDVVLGLCKVLDAHQLCSPPQTMLAACREATATFAELPGRRKGEEWFDQFLSSSSSNALRRALTADPSLRPQVQSAAQAVLASLFDRPDATMPIGEKTAASRQELQQLAK